MTELVKRKCSHKRCAEEYSYHRWAKIAAHDKGWFFMKTGEAYCPKHHPDWVEQWREKMKRGPWNG